MRQRIARACERSGRDPQGVQLIAVSKTHEADVIREAAECGLRIFGESKVEALAKQYNIPHFAKLPIDPVITTMVDAGEVESVSGEHIAPLMDSIEKEI